jgi:hypothetical protein
LAIRKLGGSGNFSDIAVPYTVAFADNGKKIRYSAPMDVVLQPVTRLH